MLFLAEHNLSFHGLVAKSVIQVVDSVGVFLSALGLHNYNRLLALHLQKSTGSSSFIFITKCPLNSILKHLFCKIFLGGMPPDPLALHATHADCGALHNKFDLHLIQRAPLIFYAPAP